MSAYHSSFQTLVSNNCFQSYCYAAAALLLYLQSFRQFLEHLQITKQNGKLNYMKSNLWKALHDPLATLSEIAILALYDEAIFHPYIKAICSTSKSGEKQNMLDLGLLHQRVSTHIFRPLLPILSIFFAKIPPLILPFLKEMNGSTLISSNPSKTLI